MRRSELTRSESDFTPFLDEIPFTVKLQNASGPTFRRVGTLPAVSDGNKNISIGRGNDIARLVELTRTRSRGSGFAQRHQHFAFRTELNDLVPFGSRVIAL